MNVLTQRKLTEFETKYNYSKLPLKERENLWQEEAVENLKDNPFLIHRLLFGKAWSFWRPYLNPQAYSLKSALASAAFLVPLYLLAIYALVKLWREPGYKKFVVLIVIYFLSVTALHALTIAMIRYRVPYVDAYLSMLAGIGFIFLLPEKFSRFFLTNENQIQGAS